MKFTAKQRIERTHVWLFNQPETAAFAGILMTGNVTYDDPRVSTAATDGLNVIYNSQFIEKLSDQELRGLVLHEALHKAYRQIWLWKHLPDKQRLNRAMDYVINLELVSIHPDVKLPSGGLIDTQYCGMDTQQVYNLLDDDGDGGFDEHDFDGSDSLDEPAVERIIDEAIRQGQIHANKIGAGRNRTLDKILEPKVDWRNVLRDFLTDTCQGKDESTWRKPNRRYLSMGIYMPSTISEACGRLAVCVDASGSIADADLAKFMSELVGICKAVAPAAVDLLYWDTRVARHETYAPDAYDRIVTSTKPAGGGGTSPSCLPRYIKDNNLQPQAVVVLTDGWVDSWGADWPAPVIWCIVGNKSAKPSCGVTCHVNN